MRRLLFAALLIVVGVTGLVGIADAAPPTPSGTIVLNESGPYAINDNVTFTTTVSGLKGNQWPMVYLLCAAVSDGHLLQGSLDHPDVVFELGAGWSPWRDPVNVGEDANCVGRLYAYSKQAGGPTFLAETASFFATGP